MKYLLILAISFSSYANYLSENVEKMNWNGVEVIWLKSNDFPTFSLSVYFGDGALADHKSRSGETELMFQMLSSGTDRYSQKQIADNLEFYGVSYDSGVTHEYSTLQIAGLANAMVPSMKLFCHMFKNSTFTKKELKKVKNRKITGLRNLVSKPQAVASRVFRAQSLKGTNYAKPVGGTVNSLRRIKTSHLIAKRKEFNNSILKRVYITGPKSVMMLQNVFKNDCEWSGKVREQRVVKEKFPTSKKKIYFVPIAKSNQVQLRMGRYITTLEAKGDEVKKRFTASYLGGGFTSRLMQELRVKRGLTYSASAVAASQREYGRVAISTFTKNETIVDLLDVIKKTLLDDAKSVSKEVFERSKRHQKGTYLLSLESSRDFLDKLLYLDHVGKSYDEVYAYSDKLDKITPKDVQTSVDQIFSFDSQVIVLTGDKSVIKKIRKAGYEVEELALKSFL